MAKEVMTMLPQFDRAKHGCLYDRGGADAYYGRPAKPHWYPKGTYHGEPVTSLNEAEVAEYMAGFNANTENKDWDG